MATTMTDLSSRSAAASLQERVLLVAPTLGWWKGQYKLPDAEIHLGEHVVNRKQATTPQIKLLEASGYTQAWKKKFNDLDNERNTIVAMFSRTFPIRGVRIIPRTAAEEFFDALIGPTDERGRPAYSAARSVQSLAFRLQETTQEFIRNFDRVLQEIKFNTQADVWRYVYPRIPTAAELPEKFYVDVLPIELHGSAGADGVTRADLQRYDRQIQASTMRMVEAAIEEMVCGPRDELAKAITELHNLIGRDGHVTDRSFNGVRAAIAQLRMFSFVADDDTLRTINELASRIEDVDPAALTSDTAAGENGLLTALNHVRQELADEQTRSADIERFGRQLRGFDV